MARTLDVDSLFKGMSTKTIAGKGNNMNPGLFEVTINDAFPKAGENRKKPGDWFIVEFTIDKSDTDKNKAGTTASWVLSFNWDSTLDKITMLVYAILGWEVSRDTLHDKYKREVAELYARCMSGSKTAPEELAERCKTDADLVPYEKGMFNGTKLKLECSPEEYEKEENGKTVQKKFTRFAWSPLPEPAVQEAPTAA